MLKLRFKNPFASIDPRDPQVLYPVASSVLNEALQVETDRRERFQRQLRAYQGQLDKPLKIGSDGIDDNVCVNWYRLIIDKGVSALFGEDLDFGVDEETENEQAEVQENPAEVWLDACWKQNKKMSLLGAIGTNGGIFGHAFVRVENSPDYEYPRLTTIPPEQMFVKWDARDIQRVEEYIQLWKGIDAVTGKPVSYKQTTTRMNNGTWQINDEVAYNEGKYEPYGAGVTTWPYEWSPIHQCQNLPMPNEFWGLSDIEDDTITLGQNLNFVASNINRILKFHAHPKTWGSGFDPKFVDSSIDSMMVFPNPEAKIQNLEMHTDLSSSLEFLKRLCDAFHEQTRIPEVASGKLETAGQLSGVALNILYGPLVEKTSQKRLTYGDMLEELNLHLLEMGGQGTEHEICIHWGNPMPQDKLGQAQVLTQYKALGVSQQTILDELNYDPKTEMQQTQAEQQAQMNMEAAQAQKMAAAMPNKPPMQ